MGKFVQNGTGIVVSVDDSKDSRFASGWTRDGEKPEKVKAEKPDKSWTVADLKAHAETNSIDLGEATKKDDILKAIAAGVTSESEEETDDESEESDDDQSDDE